MEEHIKTTEKDPVCGMTVDPDRAAAQSVLDGKAFYFCCQSCATKFAASPEKYLGAASSTPTASGPVQLIGIKSAQPSPAPASQASPPKRRVAADYICPMDPEVHQDHPGACPKCGMALEPAIPTLPATRIENTCPMHPEIVRSAPGSCPICGMALEPRTIAAASEANPELQDMAHRFWTSLALTAPLMAISMGAMFSGTSLHRILPG